jgi:hypothetical protein
MGNFMRGIDCEHSRPGKCFPDPDSEKACVLKRNVAKVRFLQKFSLQYTGLL